MNPPQPLKPGRVNHSQGAQEDAIENSGYAVSDHFNATVKLIAAGKGAKREIEDVHLSRYACYLIVQNADPEKPIVALGQTYFAVRTREAELTEEARLQGMGEDQLRLYVRAKLTGYNKQLGDAAYAAGVPSDGFAAFQNHGYRGLYAGEAAAMIAKRKGLKKGQEILDWMNSDELAANLFCASLTQQKLHNSHATTNARSFLCTRCTHYVETKLDNIVFAAIQWPGAVAVAPRSAFSGGFHEDPVQGFGL